MYMYIYISHVCECVWRSEAASARSPDFRWLWAVLLESWELKTSHLQEKSAFINTKPTLLPQSDHFFLMSSLQSSQGSTNLAPPQRMNNRDVWKTQGSKANLMPYKLKIIKLTIMKVIHACRKNLNLSTL